MNRRPLFLAVFLLLGLAAYAWFALRQDELDRSARWQQGDWVFAVAREGIESLELSGPEGWRASFRRVEGVWEAVEGGREIQPESASEILYSWSMVRCLLYVEEKPGDLSAFGLDPPRYRLVARAKDGSRHSLAIGGDSFLSTALGTYVTVDEVPAVIVGDASVWSLVKELEIALGLAEREGDSGLEP